MNIDQILADLEFRVRRAESALGVLESELTKLRSEIPGNMRHLPQGVPGDALVRARTGMGVPGDNHPRW